MSIGELDDKIKSKKSRKNLFIESIENPAHASPNKLKKIDLEKIEDEIWSS